MKLAMAVEAYISRRQAMGQKFGGQAMVLRAFCRRYDRMRLRAIMPTEGSLQKADQIVR